MLSRERTDDARLRALLEDAADEPGERELGRLLRELRADAPAAPHALRERIAALEEPAPPVRVSERFPLRRLALVVATTLVLATVVGGVVRSFDGMGGDDAASVGDGGVGMAMGGGAQPEAETPRDSGGGGDARYGPARGEAAGALSGDDASALPPSGRRAQDYRATLRLHVEDTDELSRTTKEAVRLTRSFGGHVVSANYDSGAEGVSYLELRVPVTRVQDAIVAYSELGSILSQNVRIVDLQGRIDARSTAIRRIRERIAEIRAALLEDDLTADERARLEAELAEQRLRRNELRRDRSAVRARAAMARVSLELTTSEEADVAPPGPLEDALRGAGAILVKELVLLLYALVVAAPLAVLAALAFLAARASRRRGTDRLLERA